MGSVLMELLLFIPLKEMKNGIFTASIVPIK